VTPSDYWNPHVWPSRLAKALGLSGRQLAKLAGPLIRACPVCGREMTFTTRVQAGIHTPFPDGTPNASTVVCSTECHSTYRRDQGIYRCVKCGRDFCLEVVPDGLNHVDASGRYTCGECRQRQSFGYGWWRDEAASLLAHLEARQIFTSWEIEFLEGMKAWDRPLSNKQAAVILRLQGKRETQIHAEQFAELIAAGDWSGAEAAADKVFGRETASPRKEEH
jgi:DNA-directed RNA polymerase subunit RPC12/RpoP